ncbi:unnamed protein product [Lactuca saligna]|uniref:Uncharacterized protein n=1 Tax=Lactuca saligna TaxID=75948 RepID=A0AA35ZYL5_LACSI|nr:unnamed protein product [Lactuca saligna]
MDTTELMIQDVNSPKSTYLPPQAKIVPIVNVVFHQDNLGESNFNFETVVLSKLYLLVQITESINKRLTKVERDVATMKRLMALDDDDDDDDDMIFDDTPPSSPGNNPPSPPSLSINLPPPSNSPPKPPPPPPNFPS